jgi:hypothetical protein
MKISEKQVMQLLSYTEACYEFMIKNKYKVTAEKIKELITEIRDQQSEELKDIE